MNFVSVIIPVLNDLVRLKKCLDALQNQTYPKEFYEVIVVDNGSTDGTYHELEYREDIILFQELTPGSYAARNLGILKARGELLAFTDSDCIPKGSWLEKGVEHLLKTPHGGFVGGNICLFYQNPGKLTLVELYESITALPQEKYIENQKFAATANMFTYKKIVEKVGFFDGKLKSRGDFEWGQRVFAAGYNISFAEDACVLHPARHSFSQMLKKSSRVFGGIYDLNRKTKSQKKLTLIKAFIRQLKPPFRKVAKLSNNSKLKNKRERISVSVVEIVLHYYKVILLLKLFFGEKTAR